MRQILSYILFIFVPSCALAAKCQMKIQRYNVVSSTVYPFLFGNEKACFFAFYTANPDPNIDARGNGNSGDSVWFGYYKLEQPNKR